MSAEPEQIARARSGDEDAWRSLYRDHSGAVRRLLLGFSTLTPADVQDLVQETFVRAFRSLEQLRDPAAFRPWVLTIARSAAIRRLAQSGAEAKKRAEFSAEQASVDEDPMREEARAREGRIALVRALIEALPEGDNKETVRLFYVEGTLSAAEIAARLGTQKSTITMRLERFRARVKRRLAAGLQTVEDSP
jgi:RNA polymerase sigma-70 factor (ECF subfamily)